MVSAASHRRVLALNLYLFSGLGRGLPLPPRNFTIVDSTVPLALVNCALFVWHARLISAECSQPSLARTDAAYQHLTGEMEKGNV
jgi:hypothetical protein